MKLTSQTVASFLLFLKSNLQVFQLNKNVQLSLFKSVVILLIANELLIQTIIILFHSFFLVKKKVDLLILGLNNGIQFLDGDDLCLDRFLKRGSLDFEL